MGNRANRLHSRNRLHRLNSPRRLFAEPLEPRNLLAGVTLITHGYNGDVDGWVTAMAEQIGLRQDVDIDQVVYRLDVVDPGHDGGPLQVISTSGNGSAPTATTTQNPEITLLLNWADVAGSPFGYARSTYDVAAAVAEQLLTPGFLPDLPTAIAELPIHLLGHSRGGSLVGELAHQLGLRGVWVDQVSTWDPHPVDGIREPSLFNLDYGDAPMVSYDNVVFWDNYWRTQGDGSFDFTGEPVANTQNIQLSEAVLSSGGYGNEHSDVHLWYHGTVDLSNAPPAHDGFEEVPNQWYGAAHPDRDTSGFYYSRIVGGTRPLDGLTQELGGNAVRRDVNWDNADWPNLLDLSIAAAASTFSVGQAIPVRFFHQDADSSATITFSFDVDQNPYNNNQIFATQQLVSTTTRLRFHQTQLPTSEIAAGDYYISAQIADTGGRSRYAYFSQPVTIMADSQQGGDIVDISNGQTFAVTAAQVLQLQPQTRRLYVISGASGNLELSEPWMAAAPEFVGATLYHRGSAQSAGQTAELFVATANAWKNPFSAVDVDGNGVVEPIDALLLINRLNRAQSTSIPLAQPIDNSEVPNRFFDVDGNREITPYDPLLVINWLNRLNRLRSGLGG